MRVLFLFIKRKLIVVSYFSVLYVGGTGLAIASAGALDFQCTIPVANKTYSEKIYLGFDNVQNLFIEHNGITEGVILKINSAEIVDADTNTPIPNAIQTPLDTLMERYGSVTKPYIETTFSSYGSSFKIYSAKWSSPNVSFTNSSWITYYFVGIGRYVAYGSNGTSQNTPVTLTASSAVSTPGIHSVDVYDETIQMKNLKIKYQMSLSFTQYDLRYSTSLVTAPFSPTCEWSVECSRTATPLTFTTQNEINFGAVSIGGNKVSRPLDITITSPTQFIPPASLTFFVPKYPAADTTIPVGDGSVSFSRNSDGLQVEFGKPIKVDSLNMSFTAIMDARKAKTGTAESEMNIQLQLD